MLAWFIHPERKARDWADGFTRFLRSIEWVYLPQSISITAPPFCPICKAWKPDGHKAGCGLAEALDDAD